jgi:hypothetical protein
VLPCINLWAVHWYGLPSTDWRPFNQLFNFFVVDEVHVVLYSFVFWENRNTA